jgi:hypothetical protein
MPFFTVDEGVKEHAYEFAIFSSIVDMTTMSPVQNINYSEKHVWLTSTHDSLTQSLAHSYKITPTWVFVESLAGGGDGRRALAHAAVVRRYMSNCRTWKSSYRFVLSLVEELSKTPHFEEEDVNPEVKQDPLQEALWDVFFCRISGVEEFGFHSGLEELMWATDQLNGSLLEFSWVDLKRDLKEKSPRWTELIIRHATDEGVFFPDQSQDFADEAE